MVDLKKLCVFLVEAKKSTYAAGDAAHKYAAHKIVEADTSTTLSYEVGDWKYNDNYFGGEPYGGREVVFFKDAPVYMMVYYGHVDKSVDDVGAIYKILQNALALIPEDKPFRGPSIYKQDLFVYSNTFEGQVDNFFGEEIISSPDGKKIYRAKYFGGLVNVRHE